MADLPIRSRASATTPTSFRRIGQGIQQRGLLDDTLIIWAASSAGMSTPKAAHRHELAVTTIRAVTRSGCGGGIKPGMTIGRLMLLVQHRQGPVEVYDLNATILHLMGSTNTRLTTKFQGRDFRLTDVHGKVVKSISLDHKRPAFSLGPLALVSEYLMRSRVGLIAATQRPLYNALLPPGPIDEVVQRLPTSKQSACLLNRVRRPSSPPINIQTYRRTAWISPGWPKHPGTREPLSPTTRASKYSIVPKFQLHCPRAQPGNGPLAHNAPDRDRLATINQRHPPLECVVESTALAPGCVGRRMLRSRLAGTIKPREDTVSDRTSPGSQSADGEETLSG